ncbi:MAG: DUF2950 family protein [Verrucomicrobiaceae bacterium]
MRGDVLGRERRRRWHDEEKLAVTSEGISVEEEEDQRVLDLGKQLWPFPFPIVKGEDGKWAFDTVAGLEEIVNRRIGENELHAIDTMRLYVQQAFLKRLDTLFRKRAGLSLQ